MQLHFHKYWSRAIPQFMTETGAFFFKPKPALKLLK